MKSKITDLSRALRELHRRYLENEREEAEKILNRSLTPLDFFRMLTQDPEFAWLQPFSALIAEIDTFADEATEIAQADLDRIREQVDFVLRKPETRIAQRYQHYLFHDGDFIVFHARLNKALKDMAAPK